MMQSPLLERSHDAPQAMSSTTPILPEVRLDAVSRLYPSGQEVVVAVDNISLDVLAGNFVAIMGPSGSGKSTLLHLIGALDQPTSGRVIVGGRNIGKLTPREAARYRRREVGFIFQSFNLLPRLTVLENVALPLMLEGVSLRERTRQAETILLELGLAARLHHMPNTLSGGEKQRVAIARALINQPRLLLADEPTGNLDSRNAGIVIELLGDLNRRHNQTIIMITHNPEVANAAERVIHIRDGRIGPGPVVTGRGE